MSTRSGGLQHVGRAPFMPLLRIRHMEFLSTLRSNCRRDEMGKEASGEFPIVETATCEVRLPALQCWGKPTTHE